MTIKKSILVVDFETTRLLNPDSDKPEDQPGIVEIGAIRLDKTSDNILVESARMDMLINPEVFFTDEAKAVTNITQEQVKDQPTFLEVFPDFARLSLGCEHFVGFNINFDLKVLQWNLKRYGLELRFPWPPTHHDLMKIAKDYLNLAGKQDQKYPSLIELHQHLFNGAGIKDAHRAISDCEATVRCLDKLRKDNLVMGI